MNPNTASFQHPKDTEPSDDDDDAPDSSAVVMTHCRTDDIITGRDKFAFVHLGNQRFRSIIATYLDYYVESGKKEKAKFASSTTKMILENGSRFLSRVGGAGEEDSSKLLFVELSEKQAMDKVGHAFRDMAKSKKASRKTQQQRPDASLPIWYGSPRPSLFGRTTQYPLPESSQDQGTFSSMLMPQGSALSEGVIPSFFPNTTEHHYFASSFPSSPPPPIVASQPFSRQDRLGSAALSLESPLDPNLNDMAHLQVGSPVDSDPYLQNNITMGLSSSWSAGVSSSSPRIFLPDDDQDRKMPSTKNGPPLQDIPLHLHPLMEPPEPVNPSVLLLADRFKLQNENLPLVVAEGEGRGGEQHHNASIADIDDLKSCGSTMVEDESSDFGQTSSWSDDLSKRSCGSMNEGMKE